MILQSWIHWSRGRRPFYNKIGEVGGRWKTIGGKPGKHKRLISTQYFYFSDKNDFKKLSAVPNKSKDQEFLRELRRKDPELFHQLCNNSSGTLSPSDSGSSESKYLELLDLQAILAGIDIRHSSDSELSKPDKYQEELPPPEPSSNSPRSIITDHRETQGGIRIRNGTAAIPAATVATSSGRPEAQ